MTQKERLDLLNEGYTQDQVTMIEEGLNAGLDVSAYRNKDFLAFQMYQIREGLLEGLPVEHYAKPEFDWFQMEEIRLGLLEGVNISIYADPKIHYEKMRQLRLGLHDGINLTPVLNLDSGIIEEIREAKLAKVDISKYVKMRYDAEQLHSIRLALEDGIDIEPYLIDDFRGVAISEIHKGLKSGLDVTEYAKTEYTWQQMREIRLGLEQRVDISIYSDPLYRWRQMREIRLGLEAGLPVSVYKSLMYPADEMVKMRQELLKEIMEEEQLEQQELPSESIEAAEPIGDDIMAVTTAQRNMQAYLTISEQGRTFSKKEIRDFLESKGIVKGIQEDKLDTISQGKYTAEPILIAQGSIPKKGADGWYEFFFRTNVEKKPRRLADDSVDYQNIEWFETVKEGQKIAYYHEAEEGVDGYMVTGEPVIARKGTEMKRLTGSGFHVDDDKKTYWAAMDGMIKLRDTRIDISKKLILEEITTATGNLDFDGSIVIQGKVGSGVRIKATDDIMIEGSVGAAMIECGGSIILKQGMNSAGKGYIRAAGDIVSKFFESTKVYAGGNIQANNCLHSELFAEGKIEVMNTIVGGKVESKTEIQTYDAGNRVGVATSLAITIGDEAKRERFRTEEEIKKVAGELETLKKSYEDFQAKYAPEIRNTMDIFLKLENAIFTKEKQSKELEEKIMALDEDLKKLDLTQIVIKGNAYEGVAFAMKGIGWKPANLYNVTVKLKNNRLEIINN
ncbi:MAG: DUF342 domain-containing protein [Lachnospiraceae bacterium]|nr:DUF342 domain-containing protein [Lachnospiraceae bacterium]